VLGGINCRAEPRSEMDGFGGALEKEAIIVRRVFLVPGGHRLRNLGGSRIEF